MNGLIASVLLPLFGSALPVVIGFGYYTYQKRQDRKEELHREKRAAYQTALAILGRSTVRQSLSSDGSWSREDLIEFTEAGALLRLHASDEVFELALETMQRISSLTGDEIHGDVRADLASVTDLAKAMREDLKKP